MQHEGEHAHGMSSTETATVYDPARGRTPRRPARPPRTSTTSNARSAGLRGVAVSDSIGGGLAAPDGGVAESITRIHQTGNLLARHRDGDAEAVAAAPGPFVAPVRVCRARGAPDVRDFPGFHDDVDG